jgi:hypothetical protein
VREAAMRRALALTLLCLPPLLAQWIYYPTAGIPRTRDGKANLAAPPPKTRDGKPDLSGMWWSAGPTLPCPESIGGEKDCAEKGLGLAGQQGFGLPAQAMNIGASLPDGLPYTALGADLAKQHATNLLNDPHTRCIPSYVPRGYTLPHILKFIQTPGLLVALNEFDASFRQIFTDGRPLPVDPLPTWNGYSIAKWERDTLVVQTIGFRDDQWLDGRGSPLTSAGKITERIRRPTFGSLEIDLTVDDPKAYTKPWTIKLKQFLVVDTELMEEICPEGERSSQHAVKQ